MAAERILLIEDNPANMKLLSFLLASHGYDVRKAADAEAALVALEGELPRMILMDLQLPGMDGFELTRRLKSDSRTRDVLIVAVTAYAMQGDERKARDAGCDGYITKPIDTRRLPELVARYLDGGATGKSSARD
jgi:CheY-like chemotaxis protein